MSAVRVGISGWRYPGWRGDFYPRGLPQRRELEYAAARLTSRRDQRLVLLAAAAGVLPPRGAASTRTDFVFAVKGGRFITHLKRLRDVETPLANFFASGVLALGPKLGPVLWQLPERLGFDADVLDDVPRPAAADHPRGSGAGRPPRRQGARGPGRHDDRAGPTGAARAGVPQPDVRRRGGVRAAARARRRVRGRRHRRTLAEGARGDVRPRLRPAARRPGALRQRLLRRALDEWAARCRAWADEGLDVYVYFDNDVKGHAPHDAVAPARAVVVTVSPPRAGCRPSWRSTSPGGS